jgi:hypothetical protein
MRIDSSGNVGIGTASPTQKLDVQGSGGVRLSVVETANSASGAGVYLQVRNAGVLTGNATFRVNNAGRVSVFNGTTSDTEQFAIEPNGLLQFNSGYGSVATAFGCRAWVNFDGTGTPAIRASGNVSSITDNGTGDYTVNFTTALVDANYSVVMSSSREPNTGGGVFCQNIATDNATGLNVTPTTTAIRLATNRGSGLGAADVTYVTASIFR